MAQSLPKPACTGEVLPMGMLCGEKQLAEARRLAELQSKTLTPEEKEAIQRRRAACSERRRAALAKAEKGAPSSLKERIEQRRAALLEAEEGLPRFGSTPEVAANDGCSMDTAMPTTPDFGQHCFAPGTPDFGAGREEDSASERRRKSRRITFSAMTGALDDMVESADAANGIQAAQALAATVLNAEHQDKTFKPRFSIPSLPLASLRGAKRSLDGMPRPSLDSDAGDAARRNSVGLEAMTEKAALARKSGGRDSIGSSCGGVSDLDEEDQDIEESISEALPLLATPGRFRHRGALAAVAGESGSLPPPPARPPPQHPSKRRVGEHA
eukprot:CAMPEP_0115119778 /NCGR_PEP_ID=MMETSP0227-20121206/45292_1 /TAXON_ID=89957 /ORGANISM="Polarella glacialis, Strain CCMP 1383" /LENGTH=326 /DNA_ID=CAMNT_0002521309 /DNA_START=96 /DNA_END=1076 /DNA_ORIENTATION=-